jgi:TonB family protein
LGEICLLVALAWPALTLAWSLGAGTGVLPAAREAVQTVHAVLVESGSMAESSWMQWVAQLWMAGVLVLAVRAGWHWRQLRRVIDTAVPVAPHWERRAHELCQALAIRRPVRWLESGLVETPMMLGWIRPVILFPAGLCMRLPQDQVELLLLHELAHVQRLDGLGNTLQVAVETLLFFHPAVRWMSRRIRQDRELACDLMIGDQPLRRVRYAKALLALAEHRQGDAGWAMAATGGVLGARIDHLLFGRTDWSWMQGRRVLLASVLLLAAIGLASLGGQNLGQLPRPISTALQIGFQRAGLDPRTAQVDVRDWRAPAPTVAWLTTPAAPPEGADSTEVLPLSLPAWRRDPGTTLAPQWSLPEQAFDIDAAVLDADLAKTPAMTPSAGPAETVVSAAEVLRLQRPAYPSHARRRGLQGWVELAFEVGSDGVPKAIKPLRGMPEGVFEEAAIEALEQWRFVSSAAGTTRVQRFDFSLGNAELAGDRFGGCEAPTGTRICRDRENWESEASRVTVLGGSR